MEHDIQQCVSGNQKDLAEKNAISLVDCVTFNDAKAVLDASDLPESADANDGPPTAMQLAYLVRLKVGWQDWLVAM